MKYELNEQWTQDRINEAAERGDLETVKNLTDNYFARRRWNQVEDLLPTLIELVLGKKTNG